MYIYAVLGLNELNVYCGDNLIGSTVQEDMKTVLGQICIGQMALNRDRFSLLLCTCPFIVYTKNYVCAWLALNSLRPSDAYMYSIPSLVQLMACRLAGAMPLSEPMLECC